MAQIVVNEKDNLLDLAKKFKTTPKAIQSANGIQTLTPGESLTIPRFGQSGSGTSQSANQMIGDLAQRTFGNPLQNFLPTRNQNLIPRLPNQFGQAGGGVNNNNLVGLGQTLGRTLQPSVGGRVGNTATINNPDRFANAYQTGENERMRFDLPSGDIARIGPNTTFSPEGTNVNQSGGLVGGAQRLLTILGGGSVDVEAPGGIAGVRGRRQRSFQSSLGLAQAGSGANGQVIDSARTRNPNNPFRGVEAGGGTRNALGGGNPFAGAQAQGGVSNNNSGMTLPNGLPAGRYLPQYTRTSTGEILSDFAQNSGLGNLPRVQGGVNAGASIGGSVRSGLQGAGQVAENQRNFLVGQGGVSTYGTEVAREYLNPNSAGMRLGQQFGEKAGYTLPEVIRNDLINQDRPSFSTSEINMLYPDLTASQINQSMQQAGGTYNQRTGNWDFPTSTLTPDTASNNTGMVQGGGGGGGSGTYTRNGVTIPAYYEDGTPKTAQELYQQTGGGEIWYNTPRGEVPGRRWWVRSGGGGYDPNNPLMMPTPQDPTGHLNSLLTWRV